MWSSEERGCAHGSCKTDSGTFFGGRSAIKKIKQQGYALDRREYDPGIWSVATPVCDHNPLVAASRALAAPSIRTSAMKLRNLISTALDVAAEMFRDMGYEVPVTQRN